MPPYAPVALQPRNSRATLRAIQANITTLAVDVIVNAANSSLLGGGGVDGAIHRVAGPELAHECSLLGGCKTGQAKLTRGHRLQAKYIAHTVGPVWRGGSFDKAELLSSCYRQCLKLAQARAARTIAFPSISTGIYGYPIELAAVIAVNTVQSALTQSSSLEEIIFCCFSLGDLAVYQKLLPCITFTPADTARSVVP